uniref:UBP-type domain-containing protein n=1 Tax=Aegilops tauschii subsp. strangulata TaxID=200361 RepID=A0A453K8F2_AEGTS
MLNACVSYFHLSCLFLHKNKCTVFCVPHITFDLIFVGQNKYCMFYMWVDAQKSFVAHLYSYKLYYYNLIACGILDNCSASPRSTPCQPHSHVIEHWRETEHHFSLELETPKVWDYARDNYVHHVLCPKQMVCVHM